MVAPHGADVCVLSYDRIEWIFHSKHSHVYCRYFKELLAESIIVHDSPVKTLKIEKGLRQYHCAVIMPGNKLKLRRNSCFCSTCLSKGFSIDCERVAICGKWIDCKLSSYPKYADAKRREKKRKDRNSETVPPPAKRGRGRGRGYKRGGSLSVKGRRKPAPPGGR